MGGIQGFLLSIPLGFLRRLPIHVQAYLTILDEEGKESNSQLKFPANVDVGVVRDFVKEWAQKVDAIIKGQIVGGGISLEVDLTGLGLKTAPVAGADVEEKLELFMSTANGQRVTSSIPTIDETYIDSTGILDLADVDITALTDLIASGKTVLLVNASPSDAYGSDVTAVVAGAEKFRR